MADRLRRSPQGPNCQFNGQDPNCQTEQASTQTEELPTDAGEGGSTAAATQVVTTSAGVRTDEAEPTTTTLLVTNKDGSVYTTVSTIYPTVAVTTSLATSTPRATEAVQTEPPNVQASAASSGANGVSKGAVAGIAIGTCIAGAAVAFIVALLLFKRRDRKFVQKTCPSGYPIYADSSPELVMVQKSAAEGSPYVQVAQTQMRTPVPVPARVPAPAPRQNPSDGLAGILPPAASEHDVRNRVSVLYGQIHRHIDTYYRDVHASITPSMNSDLASFGKDVDLLELLQNCSNPTLALKHALVAFVLGTTGPKDEGTEQTVWPDDLMRTLSTNQGLPPSGMSLAPHVVLRMLTKPDSTHLAAAQALHRRLTVYLYTLNNSLSPNNHSQSRLSNLSALSLTRKTSSAIREAAEHFSLTFFPWANPTFGDQEREGDLAGIIGEALECRVWLCGQTGEWGFEWEGTGRGAVVVSPALVVSEMRGPRRVVIEQSIVGV